jgi:hypothetical protein
MAPVAAALLPHPPLLVPQLAGGAAPELDPLREACRHALAAVIAAAHTVVLVGDGPAWAVAGPLATGSFAPYGAAVEVALPSPTALVPAGLPEPGRIDELPLSLAVAAFLLQGLDERPAHLVAATVPASLGPGAAAAIGRALALGAGPGPVGLVAMGDLSARRTDRAPGAFHPAAAAFDAQVAQAFRAGRPGDLLGLEPGLAADLLAGGRVPLQVLAGAFEGVPGVAGRVLYEDAPYGVGYLVGLLTAP